MVAKMIDGKF